MDGSSKCNFKLERDLSFAFHYNKKFETNVIGFNIELFTEF